jgi:hypothetical protein
VAVEGVGGEWLVAAGEDAFEVLGEPGPGALHEDGEQREVADVAGFREGALQVRHEARASE